MAHAMVISQGCWQIKIMFAQIKSRVALTRGVVSVADTRWQPRRCTDWRGDRGRGSRPGGSRNRLWVCPRPGGAGSHPVGSRIPPRVCPRPGVAGSHPVGSRILSGVRPPRPRGMGSRPDRTLPCVGAPHRGVGTPTAVASGIPERASRSASGQNAKSAPRTTCSNAELLKIKHRVNRAQRRMQDRISMATSPNCIPVTLRRSSKKIYDGLDIISTYIYLTIRTLSIIVSGTFILTNFEMIFLIHFSE